MAISTVSDLNSLFNTIFEDARFIAREMNIMSNLVRSFSATGWMDRKLSKYPEVTAQQVAEGVDFAGATTFDKTLEATLSPFEIMSQVILTDRRLDTDPQGARQDAATELGNSLATKMDKDLTGTFTSFTRDKGPGANTAASIAKVAAGLSVLRNTPTPNPIYVVMHPYGWLDIWTELGQPAAEKAFLGDVANQALQDFFVGRWLNVLWFTSANIAIDSDSDAVGAIFNPMAIGLDVRKAPTLEPERDASLRAWELNASAGYAKGVIRNEYGVKYTHDATEPS